MILRLKICGVSICKPLEIIFRTCLNHGKFSEEWKKENVVPVFKKGDKQFVKNYRPVSLLSICSKIFEELYIIMHTITLLITIKFHKISQFLNVETPALTYT